MTYRIKHGLTLIVLMAACLMAFRNTSPKYFDLKGAIAGKDQVPVTLMRDPYNAATVLASDTIRNGKFSFHCAVDEITPIAIVYNEGRTRYSHMVILEPGKVQFSLTPTILPQIKGGKYNTWIFGYQLDPAFLKADKTLFQLRKELAEKPDSVKEWQSIQSFMQRNSIRSKHLEKVLHNGKDPLAAVMAAVLLELQPSTKESIAIVDEAAKKLGEENFNVTAARKIHASITQALATRKGVMTGQPYVDFMAADVKGDSLQMGKVVHAHKYTLLQFWASWCVPCRAELPELRKIYEEYHSKGLEIVSFSMDNNPVSWKKASEQEKMIWPNVSDLKAQQSPVIKQYPVNGVPANVIIDQKGVIVASNVFGEELHEKIKALLP